MFSGKQLEILFNSFVLKIIMQPGSFSHSVVVRECPSRHCFISLPWSWTSLTLPALAPTFNLEFSEGNCLLLSWAGDVHTPDTDDEDTVLVSREVLQSNGISDGEFGMITQVPMPPPCSSVTVRVQSLMEWQDLALNAEVAQAAFLSQVRVLGLGQNLTLWLEGGVHVALTITEIIPPFDFGILQPMTQVEVLPPVGNEEFKGFHPISFSGQNTESFEKVASGDRFSCVGEAVDSGINCNSYNSVSIRDHKYFDQNSFELLMKYMAFRLQQQRITAELALRKDFCIGYKVIPVPQMYGSCLFNLLSAHPSLVVISKQSLLHVECQNDVSFIARIKRIDSPKEKAEKIVTKREEDRVRDTNQQQGAAIANNEIQKSGDRYCTVIVWENFVKQKVEYASFNCEMKSILKANSCVISDCLRRLMKLEISSVVELSSHDINIKTLPVSLDMSILKSNACKNNGIICDIIKRMLRDFVEEANLVINASTLLIVRYEDKNIDVLITIRDGLALKLSKESTVLLDITHVSDPPDVPHISSSTADIDVIFSPKFYYIGSEKVKLELQQHILLMLGFHLHEYRGVPQFALLQGNKGSGKTSLIETIAQNVSGSPYFLHSEIVKLKSLKGKKVETIDKKLQLIFREAVFRSPSVIFLEDLESLVPAKGMDQEFGPFRDHTMQMVTMLKGVLDDYLEYIHMGEEVFLNDDSFRRGSVMVVATATLKTDVHPFLVNPQGCHYFPCSFEIPPLESEGRVKALKAMIKVYLDKYAHRPSAMSHECYAAVTSLKDNTDVIRKSIDIETNLAMKLTENFLLPDLNHLAFRIFLQARHRWEANAKQSRYCVRCGNVNENKIQSTSSSLLSLAFAENRSDQENPLVVVDGDLEAAHQGYTPLALRGLKLSKKANKTIQVGGLAEACQTLKETLTWPSVYPNLFNKIKLRLRSGVLLYGPPGCGKTLIANSITEKCQLNLISVKGPEILSKYIGTSEQAVRDAFERASSAKPCVLFFDEFESIAPRRGHDNTGVTDRVVNQLLTQMDGVEGLTGVYILAATSRPDLVDPALLRPGRLDKCVFCPMPSYADRKEILRILSAEIYLGEEIDWTEIASGTENYSGADLQSLLSTAQIYMAQEALGESLYEGVISLNRQGDLENWSEEMSPELLSEKKCLSQVVLEKEKVRFTHRNYGAMEASANIMHKTCEDSDDEDICSTNATNECLVLQMVEGHSGGKSLKNQFKVYRRHIDSSLKEVKPSVTIDERLKYEKLYSSFSKLHGSFGKHTPGKIATLA